MNTEVIEAANNEQDLEEAAFLAEMASEEFDAPAPKTEADEAEPEPKTGTEQKADNAAQDPVEPERIEVIPGFTEEELKGRLAEVDKLKKALDTTNGTYGQRLAEMQKRLDAMTQTRQAETAPSKPETAQQSEERLKRLKAEFPELADLLAQDLDEVLSGVGKPDEAINAAKTDLQRQLDEERQAREQELVKQEIRLLQREHPDWQDIASYDKDENGLVRFKSQDFGQWVLGQPQETQDLILNGRDAFAIADKITEFKNSLKQRKQNNLRKAVQPRGTTSPRSTVEDEEERMFREELEREEY